MNTKVIIAAIVGSVVSFLLGWLVYGTLLMDLMTANTTVYAGLMKEPPVLWAIFLSGLVWAILIAYIFDRWANTRTFMQGFTNGMIINFPFLLSMYLGYYAFMNLYSAKWMCIDIIIGTLFWGIVSGAIAMTLGSGKKAAA